MKESVSECNIPTRSPIPRRGYIYVVLAATLWAISGSSAKFLFHQGMTPLQLVQIRLTVAAAVIVAWVFLRNRRLLRISPWDIPYFAILGMLGLAMVNFTYFLAISKIKVAAAILLEYLAPVFIALHAVAFAREKLNIPTLLAILGAITGCYLVVGGYNLDILSLNRDGVIAGVISAMAFAWYSVYGEHGMRRYHPWTVLSYAILFAAVFWNLAHFLWSGAPQPFESVLHRYSTTQWVLILYIGILGTIVPFGLYFEGINLIRSTRASITATLEPIAAGVISYFFLNETLDPLQVFGGTLVIGSIVLLQIRKEYDDRTPALIRGRATESA